MRRHIGLDGEKMRRWQLFNQSLLRWRLRNLGKFTSKMSESLLRGWEFSGSSRKLNWSPSHSSTLAEQSSIRMEGGGKDSFHSRQSTISHLCSTETGSTSAYPIPVKFVNFLERRQQKTRNALWAEGLFYHRNDSLGSESQEENVFDVLKWVGAISLSLGPLTRGQTPWDHSSSWNCHRQIQNLIKTPSKAWRLGVEQYVWIIEWKKVLKKLVCLAFSPRQSGCNIVLSISYLLI